MMMAANANRPRSDCRCLHFTRPFRKPGPWWQHGSRAGPARPVGTVRPRRRGRSPGRSASGARTAFRIARVPAKARKTGMTLHLMGFLCTLAVNGSRRKRRDVVAPGASAPVSSRTLPVSSGRRCSSQGALSRFLQVTVAVHQVLGGEEEHLDVGLPLREGPLGCYVVALGVDAARGLVLVSRDVDGRRAPRGVGRAARPDVQDSLAELLFHSISQFSRVTMSSRSHRSPRSWQQ